MRQITIDGRELELVAPAHSNPDGSRTPAAAIDANGRRYYLGAEQVALFGAPPTMRGQLALDTDSTDGTS
jgi:hypothetical protein